ncbi:MAG: hypothetical protein LBD52_08785 [Prevotellaceae bacterium]|nr:hypothetical protein [Prevotellaceae bacterium]
MYPKGYWNEYLQLTGQQIPELIKQFDFSERAISLEYLTKSSAVYSSNIEGE